MSTKDHSLLFNHNKKHETFGFNAASNGQYSNLNLNNQNKQCFSENTVTSTKCVITNESRNSDTNNSQNKKEYFDWKKHFKAKPSDIFEQAFEKRKENCRKEYCSQEKKDQNKNNSSTLSPHITAYENSINITSGVSMNDDESAVIKKNKEEEGLIKKWKNATTFFSDSVVKAVFEFSRQQEEDKTNDPEIMQFKTSQKLFNPNQAPPSDDDDRQQNSGLITQSSQQHLHQNFGQNNLQLPPPVTDYADTKMSKKEAPAPALVSTPIAAVKQQRITNFLSSPFDPSKAKPLMTSTPISQGSSSSQSRKRKNPGIIDKDANQMILDVGQKNIGTTNCKDCGMVYNVDDIKDREAHDNFHNRFTNIKLFKVEKRSLNSWKNKHYNEVNVGKVSGTIFRLEKKGKSSLKTKFESIVKEIVDVHLHICDDVPVFDPDKITNGFVYIVDEKDAEPPYIGAVVMTEKVYAAKLMPAKKVYQDVNKENGFVAVERLWVHPTIRRKGVASHLLDVILRLYSAQAKILLRSRIAFNEPNSICVQFAKAFLDKDGKWMEYDGIEGNDSVQSGQQQQQTSGLLPQMKKLSLEKKEEEEPPKKIMKVVKKEGEQSAQNIIKTEKESGESSKAIIKNEDKENSSQRQIKKENDTVASKIKKEEEPGSLKNLCRTIVIGETMNAETPIEVPLLPPTV